MLAVSKCDAEHTHTAHARVTEEGLTVLLIRQINIAQCTYLPTYLSRGREEKEEGNATRSGQFLTKWPYFYLQTRAASPQI